MREKEGLVALCICRGTKKKGCVGIYWVAYPKIAKISKRGICQWEQRSMGSSSGLKAEGTQGARRDWRSGRMNVGAAGPDGGPGGGGTELETPNGNGAMKGLSGRKIWRTLHNV